MSISDIARAAHLDLRPRPPAVRPGVAGRLAAPRRAATSDCADLSKERCADERARRADLIAFHLPMHTATRLAAPVHPRRRGDSIRPRASARTGCTRRSTRTGCGRSGSTMCSAASSRRTWPPSRSRPRRRTGLRETAIRRRRSHGRLGELRGSCDVAEAAFHRSRSIGLAAAPRYATLQMRRRHAPDRRLHRGEPRLPAPVPPLPGRAGLQRTVPRRAAGRRAGRHRRAGRGRRRSTSPSAIPISSTARRTPCASSRRCTRRIRR